ncbi:MAG: TRAP transporter small permease [Acidobacteriia bacterium]|nr:TRAP transporter small permease [Methyloceanibacter sp.]MBX5471431.1 TRAP transporter small permease [Acetobacteraceae bacterium]MCL6491748.1 TRAP transporter small permease [Terriglobia bacterium]
MRALFRVWSWLERVLIGLLGLAALLAGTVQVVGRYVTPEHAIDWAEEAIVYLIVWAVMLAGSDLVQSDGHVRPDVVLRILPLQARRVAEVINCTVAIAFCVSLVWFGATIVAGSYALDERSSTDLRFPMWLYDLALPVGFGLMAIRYVLRLIRLLFAFDPNVLAIGEAAVLAQTEGHGSAAGLH